MMKKLHIIGGVLLAAVSTSANAQTRSNVPPTSSDTPETQVAGWITACDNGNMIACSNAGAAHGRGFGTQQNFTKAKSYYELACNGKVAEACANYALMALNGEAGPKDDKTARAYMKQACDLGSLNGCANYSNFAYGGVGGEKDLKLAREISHKGCNQLSPQACMTVAQMSFRGEGGPVDYNRARAGFGWACQSDLGLGCFNLGVMYLNGTGTDKDTKTGAGYIRYACELKDPLACSTIEKQGDKLDLENAKRITRGDILLLKGENFAAMKRQKESFITFQEACAESSGKACHYVGLSHLNGLHGAKDREKAKAAFEKACGQRDVVSCQNVLLMNEGKL